jgi:outer membrane protein
VGVCLLRLVALLVAGMASMPVHAQDASAPPPIKLSAIELFAFADTARDQGDFTTAETAYRALSSNPDLEVRTEARFRLGMMLADKQGKWREAAVEFRKILDEKPGAGRVRLELARMNAMMGRMGAAEREFRAAQAAGLPPEVEQMVRFYANALSASKPIGGSIEIAIAPDSNINRATKSDTLGTIIGDFTLDQNAQARSGVGLSLRGQSYLRGPLGKKANLLVRLSGSGDIYHEDEYNDFVLSVQAGPEFMSGKDKFSISAGPGWRWYGMSPYSVSASANASWQHPTGKRSQLRVEGSVTRVDNRRNDLQDSWNYTLSAGIDRAFSARAGGGLQLYGIRESARDPGFATATGGISSYVFREFGKTSAVLTLGYSHLEADQRLFLYPRRRVDDRFSASLAGTFRALRVGSFAPLARIRWERNKSTIVIYDYKRLAGEVGIVSAF